MFGNSVSRAYHDFPGHGSYDCPGKFNRSPLGIQNPKLVFTLRQFQEGRRVTGPFRWACAQGRYGPGPRAYMGLGSRPVWALGSRCRTIIYVQHYLKPFYIKYHKIIRTSHRQLTSCHQCQKPRDRQRVTKQSDVRIGSPWYFLRM